MGPCHRFHIKGFPIGRLEAMEAISVPRGNSTFFKADIKVSQSLGQAGTSTQ